ncbi:hypothetical protein HOP50_13g70490 [Chloropicon primus]|uniref:ShKT domain-containing protein n=1 Tax=Chloropicon primus TaxID=1764295 RepID=A0A5B8MYA1_9CHLO|nr:hypothetical protein A3770_13p70280 [Chloropicon primus]UPR03719.1 hypothetical protein HOP50_13g70490 [Chloropicon primus]|eukprot:QDZ24510.1 hypothetical protein A3770_13p70280 [Chloropicon primus]
MGERIRAAVGGIFVLLPLFVLLLLGSSSCVAAQHQQHRWCEGEYAPPSKAVRFRRKGLITEESGIAASRLNPGIVWLHNDNFSPKHIFAVQAKAQAGRSRSDGAVVQVLDLEGLPKINHHTDFEDISVAHCPFQDDETDGGDGGSREWCIWIADTGSNFGPKAKEILMYVIKEPKFEVDALGNLYSSGGSPSGVRAEDTTILKLKYDPGSYWKQVPNVEAMVTHRNGSKFWLIEKTFSKAGNGPSGVWESPDLGTRRRFRSTNAHGGLVETCTRTRPAALGGGGEEWRCDFDAVRGGSKLGDFMNATEKVDVHHVFLSKVNEVENPYPDCTRFGKEAKEHFSVFDYPDSLPVCTQLPEKQPDHSCRKQRDWGKCGESWMIEKNYCELTCRRCRPPPERDLAVRSVEEPKQVGTPWEILERNCNETKRGHRNIRNIAAADLHDSGKKLLLATYGGIFEYTLTSAFDFTTLAFARQVSTTNRDGSEDESDEYWKGQEGVAYDYTGIPSHQEGKAIWSVSEHHEGLYYLPCAEDKDSLAGASPSQE